MDELPKINLWLIELSTSNFCDKYMPWYIFMSLNVAMYVIVVDPSAFLILISSTGTVMSANVEKT